MKKGIVFLLLFGAAFALYAQTRPPVSIYVPPVRGRGIGPEDNYLFFELLTTAIAGWNYTLAQNHLDADFSLTGTIFPNDTDEELFEEEPFQQMYVFHLVLQNIRGEKILVEQDLIYGTLGDAAELFPVLVFDMLYTIAAQEEPVANDAAAQSAPAAPWNGKQWYFGASVFWTPRVYLGAGESVNLVNFGFGLSAELHFLGCMSVEAGLDLAPDWIMVSFIAGDQYRDLSLEIPFSLKGVFKPSTYFMLEPYIGGHFNIPFYRTTHPPLFSWMAGFQYGVKTGSGVLFFDPCFSMDIGDSSTKMAVETRYQRYIIRIALGYKYGIGNPRRK